MFCGTPQVESTNQGSKYFQGYFDKEYVITNPQGVTQNLDFTSKFPPDWFTDTRKIIRPRG
jgi:hypothetical protein